VETYFKLRIFTEYVIPIIVVVLIFLFGFYKIIMSWLKSKLLQRFGYRYEKGLGTNVSLEFQSHWKKGKTKINYRRVESLGYLELRKFLKSEEER
jgi:hypothetical protein